YRCWSKMTGTRPDVDLNTIGRVDAAGPSPVTNPMFSRFERYINPTAVPENPEPPAGLVAFLWHFARQAKALFVALFIIEFFVALTDSAVPWFMGRVVT